MEYKYARRMSEIKASEIRELLKLTEKPEVISFAGGLPAPELFPIEEIRAVNNYVLDHCGEQALQYTTTEGWQPLRKWIAERMNAQLGTSFCDENIMITHGSQQALDLSGKVFLDEGDVVLCESPTYLAAISAFKAYGCRFVEIDTDDEGMIPASLEKALEEYPTAKLIYIIPNFQNPTGKTWSLERRKQAAELSAKYRVAVIEDNPYGELRYEGGLLTLRQVLRPLGKRDMYRNLLQNILPRLPYRLDCRGCGGDPQICAGKAGSRSAVQHHRTDCNFRLSGAI